MPRRAASARTTSLVVSPSGNSECASCSCVSTPEHVGLVLAHVDRPVHLDRAVGRGLELRVVPGRDRVEPERERPVEHGGELDLLVAAQARVGRTSGGVLGDEVVDDVVGELLAHVPDVERDAELVGGAAGVAGVLDRAAAAGARAVRPRVAAEGEVYAGDVVTGVDGSRGGDRGVDAAGHGRDDPHDAPLTNEAFWARWCTAGRASSRRSTSASVEVWPRLNRSDPRAATSS